jgi:hypothetical protein
MLMPVPTARSMRRGALLGSALALALAVAGRAPAESQATPPDTSASAAPETPLPDPSATPPAATPLAPVSPPLNSAPPAVSAPPPGYAAPAPIDAPSNAELPPSESKPYRRHGLYFRAEAGAGLFRASASSATGERNFAGTTPSWALALGGSLRPGFVLGGGVAQDRVVGLSGTRADGTSLDLDDATFVLISYGGMFDIYPDPEGGFHFQGFVGPCVLSVERGTTTPYADDPSGIIAVVGVGYEWWLGRGASLGVALRGSYAALDVNETQPAEVTVLLPALVATFTAN